MDTLEAKKLIEEERLSWMPGAHGRSDIELLRLRERAYNGLTMGLALGCFPAWIFGGHVIHLGDFGGVYLALLLTYCARQCSARADRCKEARELIEGTAGVESGKK